MRFTLNKQLQIKSKAKKHSIDFIILERESGWVYGKKNRLFTLCLIIEHKGRKEYIENLHIYGGSKRICLMKNSNEKYK